MVSPICNDICIQFVNNVVMFAEMYILNFTIEITKHISRCLVYNITCWYVLK